MPPSRRVAHIVVASCAAIWIYQVVLPSWRYLPTQTGDFEHYWEAGLALSEGRSPYEVDTFDYPPALAFVVAPLAALPFQTAREIWFFVNLLALLASAWVTWSVAGGGRGAAVVVAMAWTVAGTMAENLALGQVTPSVLLLVLLAIRAKRPHFGGALLGVAVALKIWPAVLGGFFLLRRRWVGLLAMGLVTVILILGPILILLLATGPPYGPVTAGYWRGTPHPLNFSLPGVALRIADPPVEGKLRSTWLEGNRADALNLTWREAAPSLATSAAVLAVGLVSIGLALRRGRCDEVVPAERDTLASLALLSLCPLASPIAWYHYQIVQVPVVAVLGIRLWRDRGRRRNLVKLVALALLLLVLTRTQYLGFGAYVDRFGWTAAAPVWLWTVTAIVPLANLVLFGWSLVAISARDRG